jgi:hypothetical protein
VESWRAAQTAGSLPRAMAWTAAPAFSEGRRSCARRTTGLSRPADQRLLPEKDGRDAAPSCDESGSRVCDRCHAAGSHKRVLAPHERGVGRARSRVA